MSERKHSALYRYIEHAQGERPWGTLLDAGTGVNSIAWVAALSTERWTAVTGSGGEADRVRDAIKTKQRAQDQLIVGNWADPQFLKGERFDTVIADYLLGAVERFAPYFQPYLFARLRPLTRGVLYVTGLEPYVPGDRPTNAAARIVWEIGRFRDACQILAGDRPLREYPAPWVVDHVKRAGFEVHTVEHFEVGYKTRFVNVQIDMGLRRLDGLTDPTLADALKKRGEALRTEALDLIENEGALRACRNYVVAAKPV
ncbi:MAG: class I SAM-dependent methyltransferase [Pseudomonadota bacterium]